MSAAAQDWVINPVLTLGAIVTDRTSTASRQNEGLVLEVSPGVGIRRQGGRVRLGLNYSLQNLYYAREGDNEAYQRLLATANNELVRDRLFLDVDASIRQTLTSGDGPLLEDNIIRDDRRTSVYTLSFNPYWVNDFAGYVESLLSYDLSQIYYDSGQASDSVQQRLSLELDDGRRFTALNWNVQMQVLQQARSEGEDTEQRSLDATVGYALSDELTATAEVGYREVDLVNDQLGRDGSFWRAGLYWIPSRYLRLEGLLGGDNSRLLLGFYPTTRTSLEVSRLDQDVGTNTGTTWNALLAHRSRHTTWRFTYTDNVTTAQSLSLVPLELDDEGRIVDPFGQVIDFDDRRDLLTVDGFFPLLTDEEFRRKRAALDVTYSRRQNVFSGGLFTEEREQGGERSSQQVVGGNAAWSLRLAPRTTTLVVGQWQQEVDQGDGEEDAQAWALETGLNHTFPGDMAGSVRYLHIRSDRTGTTEGDDFRENRLSLLLQVNF